MAETTYPFEVKQLSREDGGGFLVTFPDLPGCMADGPTIMEAITNAMDAEASWLATAREFGDPLPASARATAASGCSVFPRAFMPGWHPWREGRESASTPWWHLLSPRVSAVTEAHATSPRSARPKSLRVF